MSQPSGFNTFTTDYDKVDLIDINTWAYKKTYDEKPFLVVPNYKFNLKLGDTMPCFRCFVKKLGEQFGDPITLPNLDQYVIYLNVFNYSDNIIFKGRMNIVNLSLGELGYQMTHLDFSCAGVYYAEVEFTDPNGMIFTLPDTHIKYEIIVRE